MNGNIKDLSEKRNLKDESEILKKLKGPQMQFCLFSN